MKCGASAAMSQELGRRSSRSAVVIGIESNVCSRKRFIRTPGRCRRKYRSSVDLHASMTGLPNAPDKSNLGLGRLDLFHLALIAILNVKVADKLLIFGRKHI